MLRVEFEIINKLGLHARAAAKFVTTASQFGSDIQVHNTDRKVNGKSIMGVMMLAAGQGSILTLTASGEDETAAVESLLSLVNDRFGEGE